MPKINRFGFVIPDSIKNKMNSLPRTVAISPYLVYAMDKITDELLKNPQLKPENFSIRAIEQLSLIDEKETKKTSKKKV